MGSFFGGTMRRRRNRIIGILVIAGGSLILGRAVMRRPEPFAPTAGGVRTVVDGDTLQLTNGARIRLLGIDAPELGGPEDGLAREAGRALSRMVLNRQLALEYGRETRDRYGRWLAYCLISEDTGDLFVNAELVRLGLARAHPGGATGDRRAAILAAEDEARAEGRGIWASGG